MANWKTTLTGLIISFIYLTLQALSTGITAKDAVLAGGIAALGALAKDFNVSGNKLSGTTSANIIGSNTLGQ